jgi:hypothetical protein
MPKNRVLFYQGRSMSVSISSEKLSRLVGTVHAPMLIDVRNDEDVVADPRLIPRRRSTLSSGHQPHAERAAASALMHVRANDDAIRLAARGKTADAKADTRVSKGRS